MDKKARIEKVVSQLPGSLEKNTIYYVRVGDGFDIYITNNSGLLIAYPSNYISREITLSDDFNAIPPTYSKIYRANNLGSGVKYLYGPMLHLGGVDTASQIQVDYNSGELSYRGGINGNWGVWRTTWDNFNFNPNLYVLQSSLNTQLGNYATLYGVQTFFNTITFSQSPVIPNGTLNNHAVNLYQLSNYVTKDTIQTITSDKVFKKITTTDWVIPKYLAFPDASGNVSGYIGFYMWGYEWQVNWRDSNNQYVYSLLDLDGITKIAKFYGQVSAPKFETPLGNSDNWNNAFVWVQSILPTYVTLGTNQILTGLKEFTQPILANAGIASANYSPDEVFVGDTNAANLNEEIINEDSNIRFKPFDERFSGTNNTFQTRNRFVNVTLGDGGDLIMEEVWRHQTILIMNTSDNPATFIVSNTPYDVPIEPKRSITLYVNVDGELIHIAAGLAYKL